MCNLGLATGTSTRFHPLIPRPPLIFRLLIRSISQLSEMSKRACLHACVCLCVHCTLRWSFKVVRTLRDCGLVRTILHFSIIGDDFLLTFAQIRESYVELFVTIEANSSLLLYCCYGDNDDGFFCLFAQ